jgi:hypothetical protein
VKWIFKYGGLFMTIGFDRGKRARQSLSVEAREEIVNDYFRGYVDDGSRRWRYTLRHPVISVHAFNHLLRLPRLTAELSDAVGGRAIWNGLVRERPVIRTPVHSAVTVLTLPSSPEEYSLGRSKQTLRRKARDAEKRGVRWALVTDPAEKLRLADLADERDRTHPREEYRTAGDANRALTVHPLWLAAYGDDDRPILVSITPTDGQWAILQYFRILEDSPEASSARYLLTKVLAEHLIVRGVRYLADNASPMGINNGLRHYQRMLGFRIVRVTPRRRRQPLAAVTPISSARSRNQAGQSSDAAAGLLPFDNARRRSGSSSRQVRRASRVPAVELCARVLRSWREVGSRPLVADYTGAETQPGPRSRHPRSTVQVTDTNGLSSARRSSGEG